MCALLILPLLSHSIFRELSNKIFLRTYRALAPFFPKPSYEIFLRTHQALAGLLAFSIWQHMESQRTQTWVYIYIIGGTFLSSSLIQIGLIFFRNRRVGFPFTRASLVCVSGIVKIRLKLSRPIQFRSGEYINLWIPVVNPWSFFQSHPFVVASWSDDPQGYLNIFVQPGQGFTQRLLQHAQPQETFSDIRPSLNDLTSYFALFSGPHGRSVPVESHETILMVASGFGIAALLPYLKQLIYGYNACKTRTRRVRLIWQIETLGMQSESIGMQR